MTLKPFRAFTGFGNRMPPSGSSSTFSMAMTVSKASSKSSPVSARTKSTPSFQSEVSGIPSRNRSDLTATPSMVEVRTTGRSYFANWS